MKRSTKLRFACGFLSIISLASCQSPPPATGSYTDRVEKTASFGTKDPTGPILYNPEEASEVRIATVEFTEGLQAEIYYPPDFDFTERLPVVVMINGFRNDETVSLFGMRMMDFFSNITWSAAIATEGLVVVNYETDNAFNSTKDLLSYLVDNQKSLALDTGRMALFGNSDNGIVLYSLLGLKDFPPLDGVRGAVIYYSSFRVGTPKAPEGMSFFLARGDGSDEIEIRLMDKAAESLENAGYPVTYAVHPTGPHGFDYNTSDEVTEKIIFGTLEFLKEVLTENPR